MLAAIFAASGVDQTAVPDAVQTVVLAAWLAVRDGRYCPDPEAHPATALRVWLRGIATRTAGNYRRRAAVRREVSHAEPHDLLGAQPSADPVAQAEARDALRVLAGLRPKHRAVLSAMARGVTAIEYALDTGIPLNTVWVHLREARAELVELLAGRGWRRP